MRYYMCIYNIILLISTELGITVNYISCKNIKTIYDYKSIKKLSISAALEKLPITTYWYQISALQSPIILFRFRLFRKIRRRCCFVATQNSLNKIYYKRTALITNTNIIINSQDKQWKFSIKWVKATSSCHWFCFLLEEALW